MTIPLITVVLDPPDSADPLTFEAKADDFNNEQIPDLADQINATVDGINDVSSDLNTILASGGFVAGSSTSASIGSGSKSLTIAAGLSFRFGSFILAVSSSDAAKWMLGQVSAYNTSTGVLDFTVASDSFSGSGTVTSWNVLLSGPIGPARSLTTASEVRAGTDDAKATSAKSLRDSLAIETLTDAATVAWNIATQGSQAKVTLGGSRTIGKPSNLYSGCPVVLLINPASYTPTWNAVWDFGAQGVFAPPASVWSKVSGTYDATLDKILASTWSGA